MCPVRMRTLFNAACRLGPGATQKYGVFAGGTGVTVNLTTACDTSGNQTAGYVAAGGAAVNLV